MLIIRFLCHFLLWYRSVCYWCYFRLFYSVTILMMKHDCSRMRHSWTASELHSSYPETSHWFKNIFTSQLFRMHWKIGILLVLLKMCIQLMLKFSFLPLKVNIMVLVHLSRKIIWQKKVESFCFLQITVVIIIELIC